MTVRDTSVVAWSAALDEIEASLEAVDALVVAGSADPDIDLGDAAASVWRWQAPEELGPIPDVLVPRARIVLAAVESMQARTAEVHAAVGDELVSTGGRSTRVGRRRSASTDEPPSPRLVDHDA